MKSLSSTYTKYLDAPAQSQHVTIEEAEALARDLAAKVQASGLQPDLVVGLANGAIFPATIVAQSLDLPCHIVKVRRKGSRYKQRLLVIKQRLRIPSSVILWGPLRAFWVMFQNRTNGLETSAASFDFDVKGKTVLMVDDCVETGSSFRFVAEQLRACGAEQINTAVYCWSKMPKIDDAVSRPDVYLHRQIQFYPWSNNSKHLTRFAAWLAQNNLTLWT